MPISFDSLFFLVGPTASGKSTLAVEVAARCDAQIVGADAFQVYAGLDILTAKPSAELRARVPHHLIGEIAPAESFDVGRYLELATRRIESLQAAGQRILIVGGTGLYVRALTHGLAELPHADADLREQLDALPLEELQGRLRELDPLSTIDFQNPRRVIRALEVCLLTGKPFSSFRQQWQTAPEGLRGIVLSAPRALLYERIEKRTRAMFEQGVLEEVRAATGLGPTAGQAIGLREIRELLAGEISREHCIEDISKATRHYAKRQLTWFKKESPFEWQEPSSPQETEALAERLSRSMMER